MRGYQIPIGDDPGETRIDTDATLEAWDTLPTGCWPAVHRAVILIDANGLEPQTLNLSEVCRHRRIPTITVIDKWIAPAATRSN